MKIVIAGIESIGKNLAELFVNLGHDVTVIERSEKNLASLKIPVKYVIGDICNPKTLEEAEIQDCTCFLPLTLSYTANMVSSYVAKKNFNVPITIANITCDFFAHDEYTELYFKENFMIDYGLNHDKEIAKTIYNLSIFNNTFDYIEMDEMAIFAIKCMQYSDIANTPLVHLKQIAPELDIRVISIVRNGDQIILPKGQDEILVGDMVYIASHISIIDKVMAIFGIDQERSKNIVVGGNNIGKYLLELFDNPETVFVKDKNDETPDICGEIIEANIKDFDFLNAIDYDESATFIAITDNDEHNLILSQYAQKMGIKRTITYAQNENLKPLIQSDGIMITSQDVIFSRIIDYLHIGDYTNLKYTDITIATLESADHFSGKPLVDILLERKFLPLFVVRNGVSTIIDKKYIAMPNDKIIFAIPTSELKEFEEDILSSKMKV